MKGSEALNGALYHTSRKKAFVTLLLQAVIELALGFFF